MQEPGAVEVVEAVLEVGRRLRWKVREVGVIEGPEGGLGEHLIVGPQYRIDACRLVAMLVAMWG